MELDGVQSTAAQESTVEEKPAQPGIGDRLGEEVAGTAGESVLEGYRGSEGAVEVEEGVPRVSGRWKGGCKGGG